MSNSAISVEVSSFLDYSDELGYDEFDLGGCVKIICDCGFSGYVDVDSDGHVLRGECNDCSQGFEVRLR